jgi:hypothetical protein
VVRGSLAAKKTVPASAGTFPTTGGSRRRGSAPTKSAKAGAPPKIKAADAALFFCPMGQLEPTKVNSTSYSAIVRLRKPIESRYVGQRSHMQLRHVLEGWTSNNPELLRQGS